MNKKKIIQELEKRKDKLRGRGVRKIGLFGSFLKGDQKKSSDIDLIVSLKKIDTDSYLGTWVYLEKVFRKKIDLVIDISLKPELNYIKKEAVYAKI
ncbi:nucleotidyltransferase domain-containing protein [Candidatus Pacearchaeota archaeon]|nr:nucleotidyltransferase domain-containing protein [Candidatus Pacearchaeota archaeon]